jgi:hypothetical protein
MYIPIGLPTMEGPEVYMKLIRINNDRQNEVQGINVKGFSNGLSLCYTDNTKKQTVMDYFMGQRSIASVQRTLQTKENGKFIFIVYTAGYSEAKDLSKSFARTNSNSFTSPSSNAVITECPSKVIPILSPQLFQAAPQPKTENILLKCSRKKKPRRDSSTPPRQQAPGHLKSSRNSPSTQVLNILTRPRLL